MDEGAVTRTEHRVRLQVVLDLDHTLLQAAVVPEGGSSSHHARHLHTFTLRGSVDKPRTDTRYLLGLRDGLNEFLQQVEKLATVHVYTMGSKSYATEVVAIIDPTKELIKGRVLCRMDSAPDAFTKSLSHLFPDEERRSSALVLDDRVDAWDPPSREQLIQAHPHVPLAAARCAPRSGKQTHWAAAVRRCPPSAALATTARRTHTRCRSPTAPTSPSWLCCA